MNKYELISPKICMEFNLPFWLQNELTPSGLLYRDLPPFFASKDPSYRTYLEQSVDAVVVRSVDAFRVTSPIGKIL